MKAKKKIQVEKLMEDAEEWFSELPSDLYSDIALRLYMKNKKIKKSDVEW